MNVKSILTFLIGTLLGCSAAAQELQEQELKIATRTHVDTLAGTLTLPQDVRKPALIILISGSGQTDRDETLMGHKPFKRLATFLADNGVAVFRYDDRGGGQSTGKTTSQSTTLELSEDVEDLVNHFEHTKAFKHIGLLGHSEGGMIAPMVASRNPNADFIISLAGPAEPIRDLMKRQFAEQPFFRQLPPDYVNFLVNQYYDGALRIFASELPISQKKLKSDVFVDSLLHTLPDSLATTWRKQTKALTQAMGLQTNNRWSGYFYQIEPLHYWQQVQVPVLALNGDKDTQVPPYNLDILRQNCPRTRLTTALVPNHNHLFQDGAVSGELTEYNRRVPTFSDTTHLLILQWLKEHKFAPR